MRQWINLVEASDEIEAIIARAKHFFGASLFAGNCGMFALALAKLMQDQGVASRMVIICQDVFDDDADVTPETIIAAEIPVYHVALEINGKLYDGDGLVSGDHISDWVEEEYGDSTPCVFKYSSSDPAVERLIRSETAWGKQWQGFYKYLSSPEQ